MSVLTEIVFEDVENRRVSWINLLKEVMITLWCYPYDHVKW